MGNTSGKRKEKNKRIGPWECPGVVESREHKRHNQVSNQEHRSETSITGSYGFSLCIATLDYVLYCSVLYRRSKEFTRNTS